MPTPFTLPLSLSILGGLSSSFLVSRLNPEAPPVLLYFIIPMLVIYVLFSILASLLPNLQQQGHRLGDYMSSRTMGGIDDTGYLQVFPTLFAVFLLFIVLLVGGFFKVGNN